MQRGGELCPDLKSQSIFRALPERILLHALPSGIRIVPPDIAGPYELSDIPVREALRMLEHDGLIELIPYRGAHLTTLTKRKQETCLIRGHHESIANGLAAERDHE